MLINTYANLPTTLTGTNAPTDWWGIPSIGLTDTYANLPTNFTDTSASTNQWDNFSKWAPTGIDIFKTLAGLYMGMQQYGLMKDQLNLQKQTAERNYQAQKNTVNASFEDRQRARNAANPGAYQDTASYMAQYGIK